MSMLPAADPAIQAWSDQLILVCPAWSSWQRILDRVGRKTEQDLLAVGQPSPTHFAGWAEGPANSNRARRSLKSRLCLRMSVVLSDFVDLRLDSLLVDRSGPGVSLVEQSSAPVGVGGHRERDQSDESCGCTDDPSTGCVDGT